MKNNIFQQKIRVHTCYVVYMCMKSCNSVYTRTYVYLRIFNFSLEKGGECVYHFVPIIKTNDVAITVECLRKGLSKSVSCLDTYQQVLLRKGLCFVC